MTTENEGNKSLLKLLLSSQRISLNCEEAVRQYVNQWQCTEIEAVLKTHLMSELELSGFLAKSYGLTRISNLQTVPIKSDVFSILDYDFAKTNVCLPVRFYNDTNKKFELIIADPTQSDVWKGLEEKFHCEAVLSISQYTNIKHQIDLVYPIESQFPMLTNAEL